MFVFDECFTVAKLILKIENCFVTSHYNIVRRGIYMCAYLIFGVYFAVTCVSISLFVSSSEENDGVRVTFWSLPP